MIQSTLDFNKKLSQKDRLLNLLSDGSAHRTDEIAEMVYGGSHLGLSRVGARIHDLKKEGHNIKGFHDPSLKTLYWYQLVK